jgi:hypothetical protein
LKEEDILKVDIGVQVDGRICDSAMTLAFKPDYYSELLTAVREATTAGVKVRLFCHSPPVLTHGRPPASTCDLQNWARS